MEIMTRCFNMKCGKWFVGSNSAAKYCSKACMKAWWNLHKWGKYHRDVERDIFKCPFCGKVARYLGRHQKTCGDPDCQRQRKNARYNSKEKYKTFRNTQHSGKRLCLRCDKNFWSSDKRNLVICPKCRQNFQNAQEEYRFVPAGW